MASSIADYQNYRRLAGMMSSALSSFVISPLFKVGSGRDQRSHHVVTQSRSSRSVTPGAWGQGQGAFTPSHPIPSHPIPRHNPPVVHHHRSTISRSPCPFSSHPRSRSWFSLVSSLRVWSRFAIPPSIPWSTRRASPSFVLACLCDRSSSPILGSPVHGDLGDKVKRRGYRKRNIIRRMDGPHFVSSGDMFFSLTFSPTMPCQARASNIYIHTL